MYESYKPKVEINIRGYLNPGSLSKSGCFGRDPMSTDLRLPSGITSLLLKVYSYLNRSQLKSKILLYLKLLNFYKWDKDKLKFGWQL